MTLSAKERSELEETAQVFELIAEASLFESGVLETLREIYGRLGDEERLAAVLQRLGDAAATVPAPAAADATPGSSGVANPPRAHDESDLVDLDAPAAGVTVDARPAPPAVEGPTGQAPPDRIPLVAPPPNGSAVTPAVGPPLEAAPAPPADSADAPAAARLAGVRRLGDLLVGGGLISAEELEQALREQRGSGERIGAVLVRMGVLTEDNLAGFLARQYGLGATQLSQLDIDADVLKLVPPEIARKYDVLPIQKSGSQLTLAMADPTNVAALDDVRFMTNLQVVAVVAPPSAIRKAIEKCYDSGQGDMNEVLSQLAGGDVEVVEGEEDTWSKLDIFELKESADEAPVVRLVNMVFTDAIRRGASDIHLEPYEKVYRVRFRMDGVLHEIMTPPKRLEAALTSRVKIMANLDIAERRLPQDGRIKLRYNQREIDLRVSTLPTIFGEKTVMRILDKEALQLDLALLGFDPWSLEQFGKAIRQPYGMILITGPTGSGKTTTLYSAIHTINSPDVNIMTAEDPVEYNLKGVNQCQVNEEIGRTFAAALRSFLRQDPDIILVGETRDLDTAQIGIRAALTGHLVLTTLHTNDCPSTVARLLDMGIPPFLVSSALTLILAQRLGRKICKDCRQPYEADEEALTPYGHVPQGLGRVHFYKGKGCPACNFTGMKGRVAIYEVMPISEELRGLILHNAPTAEIREVALAQGMKTLRQNALQKVLDGVTTVDEVLRVTMGQ